jgi:hypothetical protein
MPSAWSPARPDATTGGGGTARALRHPAGRWLLPLALALAMVVGPGAPALAAPPPTPRFGPEIDGYARYEGQTQCLSTEQPGVVDLRRLLQDHYGANGGGILRSCGTGGTSEHKEGRAYDWMLDANLAADRAKANEVLSWLLATDEHGNAHALARRLGIMYIIWNRQVWYAWQADAGWQTYGGSHPHTDHIHFSFSWAGARQETTWWTSALASASPPFTPLTPARVLDTRTSIGDISAPIGARKTASTTVAGRGGVPTDATAVAINITATNPTADSYLTVYPTGRSRPTASSINFPAGSTVGNFVIAELGTNGKLDIYNHNGTTDVVFDVVGYYPAQADFTPLTPARVLDTRTSIGDISAPIGARKTASTTVAGRGGVPTDATAVAINITATNPTADSYLTVYPTGRSRPTASSINFPAGSTVGNFVIAELGTNGKLDIYNHNGTTDVVFDVVGYVP